MKDLKTCIPFILILLVAIACNQTSSPWIKIDDFESSDPLENWILADTRNDTDPRIENPQVTEARSEAGESNHYLIKKPAAEGVVGNRKALSYCKLPVPVKVGETYTFYLKFKVEYFPNNHVFGLSNLDPEGINKQDYSALEPSLRVTDKFESDGFKNDGTLMVRKSNGYEKITNPIENRIAKPLEEDEWYEAWMVVKNSKINDGGQKYDVYLRGGDEFPLQQKVYTGADFRMKRELPLIYFLTNCNTGPAEQPYGNGGLMYDDLYMAEGVQLSSPAD
ncbi:hypothetical protein [Ekhidna sp.]|uniref:hypothetical protein n=1 Tax=Ekhidna sp. TaxID=2608089 RepID=UPI0032EDBA2D